MSKVTILGAGYVGLPTAAHFARQHEVTVYDPSEEKIHQVNDAIRGEGEIYIHEKGLLETVRSHRHNLTFTSDMAEAMRHPDFIFIAVGTPPDRHGRADLKYVHEAARQIGVHLNNDCIVLDKSTVPPGTAYMVEETIHRELGDRGKSITVKVGSCPEFLAEGSAMENLRVPDRIVYGADEQDALDRIGDFFSYLHDENKLAPMSTLSAELTKYASNSMLATRLSFMNELSVLCDAIGADIKEIERGIGKDSRISPKFLKAGFGYGGSCFGKDTSAIEQYARLMGFELGVVGATIEANTRVVDSFFQKIEKQYGSLKGRVLALWGVGFKADTDDLRDSRAVELLRRLVNAGAHVRVFDPVPGALMNLREEGIGSYTECEGQYEVVSVECDGLIIGNESEMFRTPSREKLASMRNKVIFDGKNVVPTPAVRELVEAGFIYKSMGRDRLAQEMDKDKLVQFLKETYMG